MLSKAKLQNFGPLKQLEWSNLGKINLVIGDNGCGKTFLLKVLYSAMRTLEEYRRGDDELKSASEILAEKLYWTFQADRIGELVTKGADRPLSCEILVDDRQFSYRFGKDTTKQITQLENHVEPRKDSNSIFLPAKEVLSLQPVILKSREQDKSFGFDDTYLDLARALRDTPKGGRNYAEFAQSRKRLDDIIGGKVEYDEVSGRWQFKRGNQKFPMGVTSEGVKKIAILDTLLGNRYLDPNSIVFIDEPESALHPKAVYKLLDIVALLAERGIQFFLASHSYFVVGKLFLLAQKSGLSIPIISYREDGEWVSENLKEGMPENPIIRESIRLYKEEVELSLG
ncbi:MAG: ATP-binding protein [Gammaproteobacteria bacterium]|nr:ATP-binding protein [Gammaproteobacteria bacterium]